MEWSKAIITEFIELYRERPCLWQVSAEEYKNKNVKNVAYRELLEVLRQNGMKDANISLVKSKIQNIRRMVRKERNKVESSKRSGDDEIYVPTLWYYDLMAFTYDMDFLPSADNLTPETNIEEEHEEPNLDITIHTEPRKSGIQVYKKPIIQKSKKLKLEESNSGFRHKCSGAFNSNNQLDEYDAIGINVSAKLRKMKPEQQVYAERIIQKACFKGVLQQLTSKSTIVNLVQAELSTII